jgi:hypothetical protein
LEELEELDDSEDDSEELVLIEKYSGCCSSSTLDVDGFVAVNGECGWCTQHLRIVVKLCPCLCSNAI